MKNLIWGLEGVGEGRKAYITFLWKSDEKVRIQLQSLRSNRLDPSLFCSSISDVLTVL